MAYFIITGKNNCPNCTHALHVAEYLSTHLPRFVYRAVLKSEVEWPSWLDQINSINNWHEIRSPVIWKEVNIMGGKAHLIGSLGEFWEYCYDYYGFQSSMPKEDLEKIMADNELIASIAAAAQVHNITIIGTSNNMINFLIYEMQNCFDFESVKNIQVKIYDQRIDEELEELDALLELVGDLRDILKSAPQSIFLVSSIRDAIENCDVLIIIEDYSKLPDEDTNAWLERCRTAMLFLSDDINMCAKRSLKVILNHLGPVCFTASVLMEYCTTIKLSNIVAVTTDEGISLISKMAEKVEDLVENFWCPPVWGFSGIVSYVDLYFAPIKAEVIKPYKRSLKTKETSNLPKGVIQHEVRHLGNLIKIDDALYDEIEERKDHEWEVLQQHSILPKVRAISSLLKLWLAKEIGDDIISLGVCSNGSYDLPVGICFSQPVILNHKRVWEPLIGFPLSATTSGKIQAISLEVENILQNFGLGRKLST